MTVTTILISLLLGYFFGLIHPAYFFGKIVKGIDIRKDGSKNSGASNATIVLGWKYGVLTAVLDILKGTVAVLIGRYALNYEISLLFIIGLGIIIAHDYPFYMGFKGGKGTASVIGVFLGINPFIGIMMGLTIILATFVTDYIVYGTIVMYVVACILTILNYSLIGDLVVIALTLLSIYKHKNNLKRLKEGTEISLRQTIYKNKKDKQSISK